MGWNEMGWDGMVMVMMMMMMVERRRKKLLEGEEKKEIITKEARCDGLRLTSRRFFFSTKFCQ